ncbi:hypothetical protein V501_03226 [Pseudogymnoascus sp. VKM F-4519 (FW-2642)]|jgi:hypothetical protein|nr:hypothetical protein V501_03226 [Pseudogymnoascus sp. VKM F-4519 (FW-2642)]
MKFQVAVVFLLAPLALAGLGGKNNGNPPHTTISLTEPINSAIAGLGALLGAIPAIPVPGAPAAPTPA